MAIDWQVKYSHNKPRLTESGWLQCVDPSRMLNYLSDTLRLEEEKCDYIEEWHKKNPVGVLEQDRCSVIREIFGNPFRPPSIEVGWLSNTVVTMAKVCKSSPQDSIGFLALADALEEEGCDKEDMLMHLRGMQLLAGCINHYDQSNILLSNDWYWGTKTFGHINGCWVLNLILKGAECKK